ncbi:MAG: hypothetical protein AAGI08_13530, partial [Bacteroidota bacterium]
MRSIGCAVALLILAGCADRSEPFSDLEGTDRMRAELDQIASQAEADPTPYFHLNGLRADQIAKQLEVAEGPEALLLRYSFANELLYAGRTRQAIRELSALIEAVGDNPGGIRPENKALFDLLAISYLRAA